MPAGRRAADAAQTAQNSENDAEVPANPVLQQLRTLAEQLQAAPNRFSQVDPVTGLPSRRQFLIDYPDRDALAAAGPLMLLTLSTASHYNQLLRVLGHDSADGFVIEGARRLAALLPRECGKIYQVSVMSFAFCLPAESPVMPEVLARQVMKALGKPVLCSTIPVDTEPGLGILDTSRRAFDPSEALRAVMTAAQASRMQDENTLRWYDRDTDEAFRRAFMLLTDLRKELTEDTGALSLHYQPRIDLKTRRPNGAEALMRWNHPTLGPVSPAEFIPLAEATALITPLTQFVMDHAIDTLHGWQKRGIGITLSANISPHNLNEPAFIDTLLDRLDDAGVPFGRFELEFTEGVLNGNRNQMISRLNRLATCGIDIAIDDFGSGYSNLSYLADLPARVLKIDQSFIRPMEDETHKQRLVQSIIGLGHSFDFRVVAEGIETGAALDLLTAWGCDEGQGYHIARPMPEAQFLDWLGAHPA